MIDQLADKIAALDVKSAMLSAFGKCPHCGKRAEHGWWLKWCKPCGYVAAINRTQKLEEDAH